MEGKGVSEGEMLLKYFKCYTPREVRDYVVDSRLFILGRGGFLRKGCGSVLVGMTGIGKSVLVEQLCVNVASGTPFLGVIPVGSPRKVLLIEAENGIEELNVHLKGIYDGLELDEELFDLVDRNWRIVHCYSVTGKEFIKLLLECISMFEPDLVVVDHYQSYIKGDINNSRTFLEWVEGINFLLREGRIGLLLVTHDIKSRDVGNWDIRQFVYRVAGSSVLSNWARSSMELIPLQDDYTRFILSFSKNAGWLGVQDCDGNVLRRLVVEHSGDIKRPFWKVGKYSSVRELVKMLLDFDRSMSVKEVSRILGIRKSIALRYMEELGVVEEGEGM